MWFLFLTECWCSQKPPPGPHSTEARGHGSQGPSRHRQSAPAADSLCLCQGATGALCCTWGLLGGPAIPVLEIRQQ